MLSKEQGCIVGMRYQSGQKPAIIFAESCNFEGRSAHASWLQVVLRKYDLAQYPCSVILIPNSYQLFQADLDGLDGADQRDAARWQIRDNLDYPSAEAVVDVFDVAPFAGDRKTLNYVVASRASALKYYVQLFKDAGLSLTAIDIPEFSLRNLCRCCVNDERGTALLWLAASEGMLAIVRDGQLYLARSFGIGMKDLEPYAEGDYEALSEQLDAIVLEVQRSFDFCESTFLLPMVSRLLVAQCGTEIPAICHYLNEYLATRVESFRPADFVEIPTGLAETDLNRVLLAIGGAMRRELL